MEPLLGSSHNKGEEKTSSLPTGLTEDDVKDIESIRNYLSSQKNDRILNAAVMIACEKGHAEIVKFLLKNGANANFSSPKNGDTPLHVICREERFAFLSQQDIPQRTRIKIVQTLLQHGATFRKNEAGLTPLHLAALSLLPSLLTFLISQRGSGIGISEADEITALEMLGFSQSMDARQESNSYETLCKVVSRRCHLPEHRADPELEAALHCTEKHSLADVKAIRTDKHGMRFQGFLIGDRIIPEGVKGKYFYTPMAEFAEMCMKYGEDTQGCSIFKYLLQCESQSKAMLGTVMNEITSFFRVSFFGVDISVVPHACEVVNGYRDAMHCFTALESVHLVHLHHFMEKLKDALFENVYFCRMTRSTLRRVKRVICKLLWYDDVTYVDHKNKTFLHLLAYSALATRDKAFIVDLARVMIRHGCPVQKASDIEGPALNILIEGDFCVDVDVKKGLIDVLNPTSSILTLEEMASRTILQNRIPYQGVLPEKLCEKIEGETIAVNISALTDSRQIDSESD
ncbi:uncharacterized protein [Diadema antillarum]|uniref:uncharacterized protein n=1 Tax=Diadema antillarum TaxID=105358 RepID=UPI003A838B7A